MATFKKNALPCVTSLDQPVSTLKDVLMCKKKKIEENKGAASEPPPTRLRI